MTLALPILILISVGIIEIGVYYNDYLTLVDATREGARRSADNDYLNMENPLQDCGNTVDFYKQAACLVLQNLQGIPFNTATDDIVVSVVQVKDGVILDRWPHGGASHDVGGNPENGWSYCRNVIVSGCVPAASLFNNAGVQARLNNYIDISSAPNAGLVIVEIYHVHRQFLGLIPPGLPFLPDQVMMHAYSIMPVASAAPD
jgi:hypothetical protein